MREIIQNAIRFYETAFEYEGDLEMNRGFRSVTYVKVFVIICGVFVYFAMLASAQSGSAVPYPEGFRNWTHVKTGFSAPAGPRQGIHNIYANKQAMEGFRTGNFANGSIIVFDLLGTETKGGVTSVGDRRLVDVMHKDDKNFLKTGGWGFEEFQGDSRTQRTLNEAAAIGCFNCHAGQKQRDYVFSSFRE